MTLEDWGWDDRWARTLHELSPSPGEPGRIIAQERDRWTVQTASGSRRARLTVATTRPRYPVVGDWVVVQPGPVDDDPWSIGEVLPRRSRFSRAAAGEGEAEQVLAANIDVVWIVHGLDIPPNLRRLERYLAVAWESGAVPEIVLTKTDLAEDLEAAMLEVDRVAVGVVLHTVSSEDRPSVERLRAALRPGATVVLLGPSGVGKSTLVNLLSEAEVAETGAVRGGDRKGRHTTTRRSLFRIPGGALLLDTPGMRELRVWELGEGLEQAFPEIEELAGGCRFRDCRHESEPGCAVLQALAAGTLDPERVASYRKLRAEADWQERRMDPRARAAAVSDHKSAMKTMKYHPKYRKPD